MSLNFKDSNGTQRIRRWFIRYPPCVEDAQWHHFAFEWYRKGEFPQTDAYIDGVFVTQPNRSFTGHLGRLADRLFICSTPFVRGPRIEVANVRVSPVARHAVSPDEPSRSAMTRAFTPALEATMEADRHTVGVFPLDGSLAGQGGGGGDIALEMQAGGDR